MEQNFTLLDRHLTERDADGYLIQADGENPDQRYLTDFFAPDPFETLYVKGETSILVSPVEYEQAKTQSRADSVTNAAAYGLMEQVEEHGRYEGSMSVLLDFLADHDIDSVSVPPDFPASTADRLRTDNIAVKPEAVHPTIGGVMSDIRATKTELEIDHLQTIQTANEAAMATVEEILSEAIIEDDFLHYDGEVLTVERIKSELEMELLRQDSLLQETIISCGGDAAEPHNPGSGPLRANETIVVDIFPQDKETKYFGDMTRTFVKGTPSDTVREFYTLTLEAQQVAFDVIEAGVTGAEVFNAVCDVYEEEGYLTLRSDEPTETGFVHSLGHGVGLEIHEQPLLGPTGEELKPGHVVTVEPGLYDPAIGGVRIEDLVVVTDDGFENLNEYPKELVVG